ncbi:MAG: beta-ketoacyl-ACP synthase III [Pseudomonadota bacterium]
MNNNITARITGTGSYLPKKIVTNTKLSETIDTNDEWISTRTGIKQRHIAASDEFTSDMAINAGKLAIENANNKLQQDVQIDLIILATTTADKIFPACAVQVQNALKLYNSAAFDVQAVCAGFIYALSIANNFIKSGQHQNILVIGADKMSSIVDWSDRQTCVLFGDGAGAVVVSSNHENDGCGVIDTNLYSDGRFIDILYSDRDNITTGQFGSLKMNGKEVFKQATVNMTKSLEELLVKNNMKQNEIDWLIPHQANIRIMQAVAKKLDMPMEKVINTIHNHANTSAASIPLALHQAVIENKIQDNQIIAMSAIGGG